MQRHIVIMEQKKSDTTPASPELEQDSASPAQVGDTPKEHGGPKGPEPTRFGDWEKGGRCTDF